MPIPDRLEDALKPFLSLYRIQKPLNPPDEAPLRDYCPGAWPTMGDLKRLSESFNAASALKERSVR
jgi:hypothetical protein